MQTPGWGPSPRGPLLTEETWRSLRVRVSKISGVHEHALDCIPLPPSHRPKGHLMTNFLQSTPCSCPTPADLIHAGLYGVELVPSCPTHQADAIADQAEVERIATITAGADALETVLDKVRNEAEERDARAAAEAQTEERERRLAQLDPLAGSIARAVGAPMTDPSPMPLNASADMFASALGMSVYNQGETR